MVNIITFISTTFNLQKYGICRAYHFDLLTKPSKARKTLSTKTVKQFLTTDFKKGKKNAAPQIIK